MKQLAEEANVPLLDLFEYSRELFESIGADKIHSITCIKQGINEGKWPEDFDKELANPESVSEDTHFNKYGAFLLTKGLANIIKNCDNKQIDNLKALLIEDFDSVTEKAPTSFKEEK